jgi:hypothetical protein
LARRRRNRFSRKRVSPFSCPAEAHSRSHSPICSSAPRRRALWKATKKTAAPSPT